MNSNEVTLYVNLARCGNEKAFTLLYKHFYPQLFYYVKSRITNTQDAEDITSEIFLAVFAQLDKWKGKSTFKNYLFGIAKNKIHNHIRLKYRNNFAEGYDFDNFTDTIDDTSYRNEAIKLLEQLVGFISPTYQTVFTLKYQLSMTDDEGAKYLGISIAAFKIRHHRMRKQLIRAYQEITRK